MSKVFTYPDGTVYVERPNSMWGRIKIERNQQVFSGNTVMARGVQDTTPPKGRGKGSTIPFNTDWFDYLDNFMPLKAQRNWLRTPHMVWFNRGYVGDTRGSTLASGADPYPVLESIAFPGNIIQIIGSTTEHYETWFLPTNVRASEYDPNVFNFRHFPWIFALAQTCSVTGTIQKVGIGFDMYHMNVRKPQNKSYMFKQDIELFKPGNFPVQYNGMSHMIMDYMFVGVEIYGVMETGVRIPLLILDRNQYIFPTDWRCDINNLLLPPSN